MDHEYPTQYIYTNFVGLWSLRNQGPDFHQNLSIYLNIEMSLVALLYGTQTFFVLPMTIIKWNFHM